MANYTLLKLYHKKDKFCRLKHALSSVMWYLIDIKFIFYLFDEKKKEYQQLNYAFLSMIAHLNLNQVLNSVYNKYDYFCYQSVKSCKHIKTILSGSYLTATVVEFLHSFNILVLYVIHIFVCDDLKSI